MRKKIPALAAMALFACSGAAVGAEVARMDGKTLAAYCEHAEKSDNAQKSNPFRAGQCLGFITGTLKGWEAAAAVRKARPNYCVKPGVTVDQIMRAVTQYVRADAARQHADAELVVISAMQQAFPCPPGDSK